MWNRVDSWIRSLLYVGVRVYQRALSPLLVPSCRFEPCCSNYALEVLQTWPLGRGLWLIVKRLARCQPFCKSGFDPVPPYSGHSGHRVLSGSCLFRGTAVPPVDEAERRHGPGELTGCSHGDGRCTHG